MVSLNTFTDLFWGWILLETFEISAHLRLRVSVFLLLAALFVIKWGLTASVNPPNPIPDKTTERSAACKPVHAAESAADVFQDVHFEKVTLNGVLGRAVCTAAWSDVCLQLFKMSFIMHIFTGSCMLGLVQQAFTFTRSHRGKYDKWCDGQIWLKRTRDDWIMSGFCNARCCVTQTPQRRLSCLLPLHYWHRADCFNIYSASKYLLTGIKLLCYLWLVIKLLLLWNNMSSLCCVPSHW